MTRRALGRVWSSPISSVAPRARCRTCCRAPARRTRGCNSTAITREPSGARFTYSIRDERGCIDLALRRAAFAHGLARCRAVFSRERHAGNARRARAVGRGRSRCGKTRARRTRAPGCTGTTCRGREGARRTRCAGRAADDCERTLGTLSASGTSRASVPTCVAFSASACTLSGGTPCCARRRATAAIACMTCWAGVAHTVSLYRWHLRLVLIRRARAYGHAGICAVGR